MKASIQDNKFFGNPDVIARIVDGPNTSFEEEWETIAYGPVRYEKAVMVYLPMTDEPALSFREAVKLIR